MGLCIYTGRNTKIMMNSNYTSDKMSQIEIKVNYIMGMILVIQVLLCLIAAIFNGFFFSNNKVRYYYIVWPAFSVGGEAVLRFFSYFVLLNTMIPISLITSI